jgi:hypothetical protein
MHEVLRETEEAFNSRLRVLERRQRTAARWALISGALAAFAIVLAGGFLYTAAFHGLPGVGTRVLRTQEVVLTDSRGNERGRWMADADGTVRLTLMNPGGVEVVRLSARSDGAGVALADSSGQGRVVLAFLGDQNGSLAFADRRGATRTVVGFGADESSSILFADRNGLARAALGLTSMGTPELLWPDQASGNPDPAADTSGAPGGG